LKVYIDRPVRTGEVERAECELVSVQGDGTADVQGDDWAAAGYVGRVYDANGGEIDTTTLAASLTAEIGQEIYDKLRAGGQLATISDEAKARADAQIAALLDALETIPLIGSAIKAARKALDGE
jgi:predicted RNA-binding protein with TRAM domain